MKKLFTMIFVVTLICNLSGCKKDKLLLQETYIVEFGENVSCDALDYLIDDNDIAQETLISFKENEAFYIDTHTNSLKMKGMDYLPVGKYHATATYKDEKEKFVVEVKDTKAPTFADLKKEIVIEANAENVDLTKYFEAEDLSETKISVDKAQLDLTRAGTYGITVTASDAYKNAKAEKVVVKVVSLEEAEKNGVTAMNDGTKPQSKALKEKLAKAEEEKKAAEEAKKEEEKKHQRQQAQNNYKPLVTVNKPTTNTGNANTQKPTNPTPPKEPEKPTVCVPTYPEYGEDGKVYTTQEAAMEAGWKATMTEGSPYFCYRFSVVGKYDSCGNPYWGLVFTEMHM